MSTKLKEAMAFASLTYLDGLEQGKVVDLSSDKITIGRSPGNDIVIPSEAVSRVHVKLTQSGNTWFVADQKSRNGIQINGKSTREAWLRDGDVLQVGETSFRFSNPFPEISEEPPLPALKQSEPEEPVFGFQGIKKVAPKIKINRRVLIYGSIGAVLLLLYLFSGNSDKKPEGSNSDPKLSREFEVAEKPKELSEDPNDQVVPRQKKLVGMDDPVLKEAERQMLALDWNNTSLREAEKFFKKGQRDYLAGNYHRAIEFFQTALQLYRGHVLADRYLKRAVYDAEMEAKKNMELGIQYYKSLQYQRAIYHFGETISLMAHRPGEAIVKEAGKYVEICKKLLRAAELFP